MKTTNSKLGFTRKIKHPLKMLEFAKRKLRLNVVKDESFQMIKEIMDTLKSVHTNEGFRVASFLPVKGYRYEKNGQKTYFYYLLYWRGYNRYRIQPSVALIAVGSSSFVDNAIKQHLEYVKNNYVSYGIPAPFIRKFEKNNQKTN